MTSITIKSGSEGPRHDPYHYDEITVRRPDGREVTLHLGLAVWAEASGGTLPERTDSPPDALDMFERYAGVSHKAMERAWYSLPARRLRAHPCGLKDIREVSGYPGETFTICNKCGDVLDSCFNINAVI